VPTVSLPALVTAYRKAKVDLFYSSDPRRLELAAYETDLADRLAILMARIEGADEGWIADPSFLGDFTFAPKKLSSPPDRRASFWSDRALSWQTLTGHADESPVAEFRLMSKCSIDFHVFSTVWLLEVGGQLDGQLDASAMGSRLRRGQQGAPNYLGSGSYLPYLPGYESWRDGGLRAMTQALDESRNVVALTADVTSFYHRLEPSFLLDERYLADVLGVELTQEQTKLTHLFVAALRAWAGLVGNQTGWRASGLPVGLPASATVANLALAELDVFMADRVAPLYYGRYVDDLMLVVEDDGALGEPDALWKRLVDLGEGLLTNAPLTEDGTVLLDRAVRFVPSYLSDSVVAFENSKNKTFHLSGRTGRTMIESIRKSLRERSSEWRALPSEPSRVDRIAPAIASVLSQDGVDAVTLRDADRISIRKHAFAVRLRNFEAYERTLPPAAWAEQRREFFNTVCDQVLTLPVFFELATFLPRLIALAGSCADHQALAALNSALAQLPAQVRATCRIEVPSFRRPPEPDQLEDLAYTLEVAGPPDPAAGHVIDRWVSHLINQSLEELASSVRERLPATALAPILRPLRSLVVERPIAFPGSALLEVQHRQLARRDLAHRPYRWGLMRLPLGDRVRPARRSDVPLEPVRVEGLDLLVANLHGQRGGRRDGLRGSDNAGLAFATRPPSLSELHLALRSPPRGHYGVVDGQLIARILHALRGWFAPPATEVEVRSDWPTVVHVRSGRHDRPVRIALAMLGLDPKNVYAAATGAPILTPERFGELHDLFDAVVRLRPSPDYLVLPELALPPPFFEELARALSRSGISLIAGIEHQELKPGQLVNQVWASLCIGGFPNSAVPYHQDKQTPAIPEQRRVLLKVKKPLIPQHRWSEPSVVAHGEFRFGMLICSELTNIHYRSHLRGAIDALIVPEWNQDLHWFEALVESAAMDLHAYVAQANTLGYGDTRLRAPAAKVWARDVVRLKGGRHDYVVVGEIDYDGLRCFQTKYEGVLSGPKKQDRKTLKPLPDGFLIDPGRKRP
jgi:predicted amidohydrolase